MTATRRFLALDILIFYYVKNVCQSLVVQIYYFQGLFFVLRVSVFTVLVTAQRKIFSNYLTRNIKRRLKWVATLPLGDISTEDWSSGMGIGRGTNNPIP
jgi:hypothetical protein